MKQSRLFRAVAPRYRYCGGATYAVAVAVAPLLLVQKNGDGNADSFSSVFFGATRYRYFKHRELIFWVSIIDFHRELSAVSVIT